MPRYFFNFKDGELFLDREGIELASVEAARAQAVVASGEMLKDRAGRFWDGAEWRMWVTDEGGATVCALRFTAE